MITINNASHQDDVVIHTDRDLTVKAIRELYRQQMYIPDSTRIHIQTEKGRTCHPSDYIIENNTRIFAVFYRA